MTIIFSLQGVNHLQIVVNNSPNMGLNWKFYGPLVTEHLYMIGYRTCES